MKLVEVEQDCLTWVADTHMVGELCKNWKFFVILEYHLQCFDAVGWATGRASGL